MSNKPLNIAPFEDWNYNDAMAKQKDNYYRPSLSIDIVLFTLEMGELKVLLINRQAEPFKNSPALPGGFIHPKETTLDTAHRILNDKAGVSKIYIEQLYTFDEIGRDPRGPVVSVTYFALVPFESIILKESKTTQQPHFETVSSLPKLAFDHSKIVDYALARLASKIQYTNIIFSLLPELFTLSELQKTYELILGKSLDKRNFRKKIEQLNLVVPTKEMTTGGRQRPAILYRAKDRKWKDLEKFW